MRRRELIQETSIFMGIYSAILIVSAFSISHHENAKDVEIEEKDRMIDRLEREVDALKAPQEFDQPGDIKSCLDVLKTCEKDLRNYDHELDLLMKENDELMDSEDVNCIELFVEDEYPC
jgi:hypothetical protein